MSMDDWAGMSREDIIHVLDHTRRMLRLKECEVADLTYQNRLLGKALEVQMST